MMPSPVISLVFINYRSFWSLSLALKSLFSLEKDQHFFEVIVVNNDPKEYQALLTLSHTLPFRLLQSEGNIGFGQAANQGALLAKGKIVGFLNPDILWQEKTLARVWDFFSYSGPLTILGFTLIDEAHETERFSAGKLPHIGSILGNNILPERFSHVDAWDSLDWVSGCGLFIPQKTFLLLGGFDKDFFLYFEDVDLCLRAKKHDITVVREEHFRLLHRGGKSFTSRQKQKKDFYRSQLTYFRKHRPQKEYKVLQLLHFFRQGL